MGYSIVMQMKLRRPASCNISCSTYLCNDQSTIYWDNGLRTSVQISRVAGTQYFLYFAKMTTQRVPSTATLVGFKCSRISLRQYSQYLRTDTHLSIVLVQTSVTHSITFFFFLISCFLRHFWRSNRISFLFLLIHS